MIPVVLSGSETRSCESLRLMLPWSYWIFIFIFLGVYFEKVLKSSDTSLWVRNIQMYLSGIVVTLVGVYMSDGAQVLEKGFFYGYTCFVWLVICKYLVGIGACYIVLSLYFNLRYIWQYEPTNSVWPTVYYYILRDF